MTTGHDRYQFVRRLTAGGTSEIFLAYDMAADGRPVALKRLFGNLAAEPSIAARFRHEAFLLAQLCHPAIPVLHEACCEGNQPYLTMAYIPSVDLATLLASECLPPGCALAAVFALLNALGHVHARRDPDGHWLRVVHRDVAPSNVLITEAGTVALVDFGLATSTALADTSPGVFTGTAGYLAPEAITGEAPVDLRADLFAAGIVLYEATVGTRLFPGNKLQAMHSATESRVPYPSEIRPDYPRAVEAVVLKALARMPEDRYASAEEMADDLARAARTVGWSASLKALGNLVRPRT